MTMPRVHDGTHRHLAAGCASSMLCTRLSVSCGASAGAFYWAAFVLVGDPGPRGHEEISYNACRNRHCPGARVSAQAAWLRPVNASC
jgi:hypothetical protein